MSLASPPLTEHSRGSDCAFWRATSLVTSSRAVTPTPSFSDSASSDSVSLASLSLTDIPEGAAVRFAADGPQLPTSSRCADSVSSRHVGFKRRKSYPVSPTSPPLTDIPEGATAPCPAGNPTRYQLSSCGTDLCCFFRRVVPERVPSDFESLSSPPSGGTFQRERPHVFPSRRPSRVTSPSRCAASSAFYVALARPRSLTSPLLTEHPEGSTHALPTASR